MPHPCGLLAGDGTVAKNHLRKRGLFCKSRLQLRTCGHLRATRALRRCRPRLRATRAAWHEHLVQVAIGCSGYPPHFTRDWCLRAAAHWREALENECPRRAHANQPIVSGRTAWGASAKHWPRHAFSVGYASEQHLLAVVTRQRFCWKQNLRQLRRALETDAARGAWDAH
jgi:hypothetical protein